VAVAAVGGGGGRGGSGGGGGKGGNGSRGGRKGGKKEEERGKEGKEGEKREEKIEPCQRHYPLVTHAPGAASAAAGTGRLPLARDVLELGEEQRVLNVLRVPALARRHAVLRTLAAGSQPAFLGLPRL
jgi:hypothetical protein